MTITARSTDRTFERPARGRRAKLGLYAKGLGLLASLVVSPAVAYADAVPIWSQPAAPILDTGVSAGRAWTFTRVGSSPASLNVFNSDGSLELNYSNLAGTQSSIPPALALDGSGYVVIGTGDVGNPSKVMAIDGHGQDRWTYPVSAEATIRRVVVGSSGDAYVTVERGSVDDVRRLAATDGHVVFDRTLDQPSSGSGATFLFAENDGVAVVQGGDIVFVSAAGAVTRQGPIVSGGFDATSDGAGNVFVAPDGANCDSPNGITVSKVSVDGVKWTHHVDGATAACGITGLTPLPGGAVAFVSGAITLGVLNADGGLRWKQDVPMLTVPTSDTAGNLETIAGLSRELCSDGQPNCAGFVATHLSGADGQTLTAVRAVPSEDPSALTYSSGFGLGVNQFYVTDYLNDSSLGFNLQAYGSPEVPGAFPLAPASAVPSASPSGVTLSLSGPKQLSAGQLEQLTATLRAADGKPVPEDIVQVKIDGTNATAAGRCVPNQDCVADSQGRVVFEYRSDWRKTGSDVVTAWVDGVVKDNRPSPGEPQATATVRWSAPPADTPYVALGDSFSSGEGLAPPGAGPTRPYVPGTDDDFKPSPNKCHRNANAYPQLLADAKDLKGLRSVTFAACSGALTGDLVAANPINHGEPPQIDRVGAATKVITLTIGGDDLGFSEVLTKCIHGAVGTSGKAGCTAPCKDDGPNPPSRPGCAPNPLRQEAADRQAVLAGSRGDRTDDQDSGNDILTPPDPSGKRHKIVPIPSLLMQLHEKARNAHIFIAGYPHLFGDPHSTRGPRNSYTYCGVSVGPSGTGQFIIANYDIRWINDETDLLDANIRRAVTVARRDGVKATYVDPVPAFSEHGNCDDRSAWINKLIVDFAKHKSSTESFHPTAAGQRSGYYEEFRESGIAK